MNSVSTPPAEEAVGEAGVLLASVAHELRTPLSALASAALLLRGVVGDDPNGAAALETIQRQTRVLTRLVGDLTDTARIKTGQFSARFERIDLKEVLRLAASSCQPELEAHGHRFEARLADGPLPVVADRDRLVQVFVNLLDNAIKYTATGGKISMIATPEREEAVVLVADTGVGMSDNTLTHLFELFCQGQSTKSMSNGGLGIGLALVRSIVVMHHGTVEARSGGSGHGSAFTVRLPMHC